MRNKLIAIFLSTTLGLGASDLDTLETVFSKHKPSDLNELALNLTAQASVKHSKGDFKSAISLYDQSLKIRKEIGQLHSKGYANVVFLKSIALHRDGDSCSAARDIKHAIQIYNEIGNVEDANIARVEGLEVYNMNCEGGLISQK
ncbi:MAG: tetratricopeptide repeat protein [Leptospiraceae bacterium]|nr:tetratricopeptide repeat protein [Leptospiraceae bacterium]MCP5512239.1 tetratricopeptide repeat protein [Leptospiraceae bacterium]